jgi:hypothetical protein
LPHFGLLTGAQNGDGDQIVHRRSLVENQSQIKLRL